MAKLKELTVMRLAGNPLRDEFKQLLEVGYRENLQEVLQECLRDKRPSNVL